MTPITRWFEAHVSVPLDRIYRRIDDDAAQLDPAEAPTATTKPRKRHGFRKAA